MVQDHEVDVIPLQDLQGFACAVRLSYPELLLQHQRDEFAHAWVGFDHQDGWLVVSVDLPIFFSGPRNASEQLVFVLCGMCRIHGTLRWTPPTRGTTKSRQACPPLAETACV